MLTLSLTNIPGQLVRGIYGPAEDELPAWMRFLHADAASSFLRFADLVVVSDMFRSPESSLQAVREGRGAQPPAFSAHNYGLAIDLALEATMKRWKLTSKAELDQSMAQHGWYCHRRDHALGHEAWHFNFLGPDPAIPGELRVTSGLIEARIVSLHGASLAPDDRECQEMLAKLRLYAGDIDGRLGPLSREAIRAFRRTWGLRDTGELDARTRRTLSYVSCDRAVLG
jgi:hypothetical protein